MSRKSMTRRNLLQYGAGALAGTSFLPRIGLATDTRPAPSERITVGMIGVGRQCHYFNLGQYLDAPDVQVVAVCDVDRQRTELARQRVNEHYAKNKRDGVYKGCDTYGDFRDLLARRDIDAVMISTPDHWHVPMSLLAVQAGKDVCCEKPLTRCIREGRILADAVKKHKRIFRTDSEFRSLEFFHRACELVRNGRLGKLKAITVGVPFDDFKEPPHPDMPVPEGLDYEMWLGPAPLATYTENRVHKPNSWDRPGWMRNLDYCDGMVANWGTHLLDIAQWGHDSDRTGPVEIEGTGQYPPKDNLWNVLYKFDIKYRYADGLPLHYVIDQPFVRFEGEDGRLQADYIGQKLTAEPADILQSEIGPDEIHLPLKHEKRDFIDAVKTRGQTLEDAEVGHRTTSMCHLGQIAVRLGRKLRWDPQKEHFENDLEADQFLSRDLRGPWTLKA